MAHDPEIQALLDKQQIHDTMMGLCRGTDRLDEDLIAAAFHEGHERAQTIITASRNIKDGYHFIGNELIELDGDVAFCEFHFISFSTVERDEKEFTRIRAGRYVDRWERRAGSWKIATRIMVDDWSRLDEIIERVAGIDGPGSRQGERSHGDAVYTIRNGA